MLRGPFNLELSHSYGYLIVTFYCSNEQAVYDGAFENYRFHNQRKASTYIFRYIYHTVFLPYTS